MSFKYEDIMKTKKFLPFHMDRLTEQMVEKAERELHETDEIRGPAIEQLRRLVLNENKFKCPSDDAFLLEYLRVRKFDVQRAFNHIKNQYEIKKEYQEVYNESNLEETRKLYDQGTAYCLPYRDEEGCVIIIFKMENWNPSETSVSTAILFMTMVIAYCLEDVATQVCGVKIIMDVNKANFHQLRALTPRYIRLLASALRNSLPVRFKGIHIYNENAVFQYIWSIFKLFITDKIKGRVHFHRDNQEKLHRFIPKEILTAEYGGENVNFNKTDWCRKELDNYYEKFKFYLTGGYEN